MEEIENQVIEITYKQWIDLLQTVEELKTALAVGIMLLLFALIIFAVGYGFIIMEQDKQLKGLKK